MSRFSLLSRRFHNFSKREFPLTSGSCSSTPSFKLINRESSQLRDRALLALNWPSGFYLFCPPVSALRPCLVQISCTVTRPFRWYKYQTIVLSIQMTPDYRVKNLNTKQIFAQYSDDLDFEHPDPAVAVFVWGWFHKLFHAQNQSFAPFAKLWEAFIVV